MTNKFFQVNHQNRWLNIEATSSGGLVTRPQETKVKVVTPTTRLPTITVTSSGSLVTRLQETKVKVVTSMTRLPMVTVGSVS